MKPLALAFLFLFLVVGLCFCKHWWATVGLLALRSWTAEAIMDIDNSKP